MTHYVECVGFREPAGTPTAHPGGGFPPELLTTGEGGAVKALLVIMLLSGPVLLLRAWHEVRVQRGLGRDGVRVTVTVVRHAGTPPTTPAVRPPGPPASSSVPGRPGPADARPSVPDAATRGLPEPANTSPKTCTTVRSAAMASGTLPERLGSWLNARWITPSQSATALAIASGSARSPQRALAPYPSRSPQRHRIVRSRRRRARETMSSGTITEARYPDTQGGSLQRGDRAAVDAAVTVPGSPCPPRR